MNAQVGQVLAPATLTPIVEYTKTAAALADLRQKYDGVVFPVTTADGMKDARVARRELVTLRTDLDKLRLKLNEDDQGRIRDRNAEAKRITGELLAIEEPIDDLIKAEEGRKERERKEREEAEAKRVADIHAEIAIVRDMPAQCAGLRSDEIKERLDHLQAYQWTTDVAEFVATAHETKGRAIASMELLYEGTKAKEEAARAELQKIAEERAELARLRAEQEKRDREEQARVVESRRLEAEARERIEAEERAARLKREEEDRAARQARERNEAALSEIHGIQQQVIIAQMGRAGVRAGGTLACVKETLAETEAWPVEREHFGALYESAQRTKAAAIAEIREQLAAVNSRETREAEARAAEEKHRLAATKLEQERVELETQRRAVESQQAELLDGASMLKKFVERFGKRREFATVTKAITEYLGRQH